MEPFTLSAATGTPGAVVFSSPHSGDHYPPTFLRDSQLDPHTLRSSEDAFVDQLFATAPAYGAPLIAARYPRAYVDLNRAATELDPAVVTVPPRPGVNPRVAAGLGVIPRVVAEGRVIRSGRMTLRAAQARLDGVYHPYHTALYRLLEAARIRHGASLLVDCHSMPREALRSQTNRERPDIVLGDRFGTSCATWVTDAAVDAFARAGFRVARNTPFAGGYITQSYGRPVQGRHALQIEIDRSLYMNEKTIVKRPDFRELTERLGTVVAELANLLPSANRVAAE